MQTILVFITLLLIPTQGVLQDRTQTNILYEFHLKSGTPGLTSAPWSTVSATATTPPSLSTSPPNHPAGLATDILSCSTGGGCGTSPFLTDPGYAVPTLLPPRSGFAVEVWLAPGALLPDAVFVDASGPFPPASTDNTCAVRKVAERAFELRQLGSQISFAVVDQANAISSPVCVTCLSPPGILVPNTPIHVLAVVPASPDAPGSMLELYVNGTRVACADSAAATLRGANFDLAWNTYPTQTDLALGGRRDGKFFWDGDLFLVALHASPLDPAGLAQNLAAGPYNTLPVPTPLTIPVVEESTVSFALQATDANEASPTPHGGIIVSLPAHGALYNASSSADPGSRILPSMLPFTMGLPHMTLTYAPFPNIGGLTDSFLVRVQDAEDVSLSTAQIDLVVANVNDVPTGSFSSLSLSARTTPYGGSLLLSLSNLDDLDADAVLSVAVWSSHGLLSLPPSATSHLVPFGGPVLPVVGDGTGHSSVMFQGTPSEVRALLAAGLLYSPFVTSSSGLSNDVLHLLVDDGVGGSVTDTMSVVLVPNSITQDATLDSAPPSLLRGTTSNPIELRLDAPLLCPGQTLELTPQVVSGSTDVTFTPPTLVYSATSGPIQSTTFTLTASPTAQVGPLSIAFQVAGSAASQYAISLTSPVLPLTTLVASRSIGGVLPPIPTFVQQNVPVTGLSLSLSSPPPLGTSLLVTLSLASPSSAGTGTFTPTTLVFNDTDSSMPFSFVGTGLGAVDFAATLSGSAASEYVEGTSGYLLSTWTTVVPTCPSPSDILDCDGVCNGPGASCTPSPPPPSPPPPPPSTNSPGLAPPPPPPPSVTGVAGALTGSSSSSDDGFEFDSLMGILVLSFVALILCLLCLLILLLIWLVRRQRDMAEESEVTRTTTTRTVTVTRQAPPPTWDGDEEMQKGAAPPYSSSRSPYKNDHQDSRGFGIAPNNTLPSTTISPSAVSVSVQSSSSSSSSSSLLDDESYSAPYDEYGSSGTDIVLAGDKKWSKQFEKKWRHTVDHKSIPGSSSLDGNGRGDEDDEDDEDTCGAVSGLPLPSKDMIKIHKAKAEEQASIAHKHKEHADTHAQLARKHAAAARKLQAAQAGRRRP